jgi:hypothetical protein
MLHKYVGVVAALWDGFRNWKWGEEGDGGKETAEVYIHIYIYIYI